MLTLLLASATGGRKEDDPKYMVSYKCVYQRVDPAYDVSCVPDEPIS